MKKYELLAPAKNLEYGKLAINCGADAVYIGANKFGARSTASNSPDEIKKLIDYAHKYFAKVYVTINTILNDKEIEEARQLIYTLYEAGADAIIIQDMGLLEMDLPPIQLFASTQAHNNSVEKVKFLEKVGFKRVILARELSLDEITNIKQNTTVDLEAFVHGALCVSYSGQCYLSYAIGGRSGNRGKCAQPCRKLYSLLDKKGNTLVKNKHLLSLKDLNLSDHLESLIDAGITSFKIEGRLKDENYIKNIVSYYRQSLDKVLESKNLKKSSSGQTIINFSPNLQKAFNRGFTKYFINGRQNKPGAVDRSGFVGEFIGTVLKIDKNSFVIKYKDKNNKLSTADGIAFFDANESLIGSTINRVEDNIIYPNSLKSIKKGMKIYRNHDHEFLKPLSKANIERKIGVSFKIREKDNKLLLQAVDEDNIQAEEYILNNYDTAKNQSLALDNISNQLKKLGNTEFILNNLDINLNKICFIPKKDLNELRNKVLEQLLINRFHFITNQKETAKIKPSDYPYFIEEIGFEANIYNSFAEKFYKRHGVKQLSPAAESLDSMENKRVMTTKYCLRHQFDLCPRLNSKNSNEDLILLDEMNKKYTLKFDCSNCLMEVYF